MAEIEFSVLTRQSLDRRIAQQATLERRVESWLAQRNAAKASINWQFTTQTARIKPKSLYSSTQG